MCMSLEYVIEKRTGRRFQKTKNQRPGFEGILATRPRSRGPLSGGWGWGQGEFCCTIKTLWDHFWGLINQMIWGPFWHFRWNCVPPEISITFGNRQQKQIIQEVWVCLPTWCVKSKHWKSSHWTLAPSWSKVFSSGCSHSELPSSSWSPRWMNSRVPSYAGGLPDSHNETIRNF